MTHSLSLCLSTGKKQINQNTVLITIKMNETGTGFNILLENPSHLAQDRAVSSTPAAIKLEVKPCMTEVTDWH
jgi:hypothetical protein